MPPDNEINQEILQRLTRVETKLDMMASARDIAQEALQSTKASHHRLDELKKEVDGVKQTIKWLIATTISFAGLFIAAVGLLWKLGGAG
ncbi:MAG: hypothetical protein K0Q73_8303 [Paenibacillus sp.]|jgi:hypothetical protein|nr:hypothetical protein [Paenibacillus sp.]